jgi:methionyl-tRNA synthetase
MANFYITTAIDYVNGSPHIGHAYEKILTDVVARFRRLSGDSVHFLTGTDDHGQKVQQSAEARGVTPLQFADTMSAEFRAMLPRLEISNDDFIRTTEERHKRVVREVLQRLFDKGDIYKGEYRGFYSMRQEQFLKEKDRNPDGTWPEIYGEVSEIAEPNYLFKLRAYQGWLVDFLARHEDFVFPRFRRNEVLEFLKEPLNDLCISRPRERLEWGIPLPFDEAYVTYVWFDALVNYYSAVADRPGVWPASLHVIGKDILVPPHAVYWPIMLHAAGIELPRGLLVHGWWLTKGAKMSKSTGNVFNPLDLVDEFGADALRYFLIREMNVGQDGDFSRELFLTRYNGDLANDLGNLVNRALNMTNRFAGGVVPAAGAEQDLEREVRAGWDSLAADYAALFGQFQFHAALERLFAFIRSINAYIERRAPWKLAKSALPADKALLQATLATIAEALRLAAAALRPVMPVATGKIDSVLGNSPSGTWAEELIWGHRLEGSKVAESLVLFPRPAGAAEKAP